MAGGSHDARRTVGKIPVAAVKTNAVGQDLNDAGSSGVGLAVGRGDVVGSRYISVSLDRFRRGIVALLGAGEDDVGHVNVVLGSQHLLVENGVSAGDGHGHGEVLALSGGDSTCERSSNGCGGEGLHSGVVVEADELNKQEKIAPPGNERLTSIYSTFRAVKLVPFYRSA